MRDVSRRNADFGEMSGPQSWPGSHQPVTWPGGSHWESRRELSQATGRLRTLLAPGHRQPLRGQTVKPRPRTPNRKLGQAM